MKTTPASISLSALLTLFTIAATSAGAADKYKAPRTPWGDPVIQGIYNNNTDVPFERARELGDKASYTEEEYQARKKAAARPATQQARTDVHYETSDYGLSPDQLDNVKSLRTSMLTQPGNGRMPPLRKDAQARSDAARAKLQGHDYDSAQDRPQGERCVIWPHEGPPLRPVGYNSHVQIMQTQSHVVFMTEMIHDARVIPILKSRPDFGGLTRWQGNSWGHWEGDTLVIETTGISDKVLPRGANVPMGPEGKVIEKLTRTDANTVLYEFAVTDPSLWDVTWGGQFPMEVTEGPIFEYACHEGNYGIANTLRGAREDEKTKAREGR